MKASYVVHFSHSDGDSRFYRAPNMGTTETLANAHRYTKPQAFKIMRKSRFGANLTVLKVFTAEDSHGRNKPTKKDGTSRQVEAPAPETRARQAELQADAPA